MGAITLCQIAGVVLIATLAGLAWIFVDVCRHIGDGLEDRSRSDNDDVFNFGYGPDNTTKPKDRR